MSSTATAILQDMVATIGGTGVFALASLGERPGATVVPRAYVRLEGLDTFAPDDSPSTQWMRVRASVVVHTRGEDDAEAVARAADLCIVAGGALLADPFRGEKCRDLPVGRATEVSRHEIDASPRRPEIRASFSVRCHYEVQELDA
jgi:hypothetical protein